MRPRTSPKTLLAASAGVLVLGAGMAFALGQSSAPQGSVDTRQLRELASRLKDGGTVEVPVLSVPKASGQLPLQLTPTVNSRPRATSLTTRPVPVLPAVGGARPSTQVETKPLQQVGKPLPVRPADPLETLALVGITQMGEDEQAWLYDLDQRRQEVVEAGQQAFGFKVTAVGDETITLSKDGQEYHLRLGEKQLPAMEVPTEMASSNTGTGTPGAGMGGRGGQGGGRGNWQGGGRGNWQGGGNSRGGMNFSGRGGGATASSSGRGNRGSFTSGSGGSSAMTFGSGNRGSFSGGRTTQRAGNFSGMSGATGRSGGGSVGGNMNRGGGGGAGTSAFSSAGTVSSTSNPQTARRSGARLTGDSEAINAPAAISNPQTARRRGTTSGAAFGSTSTSTRTGGSGGSTGSRSTGGR